MLKAWNPPSADNTSEKKNEADDIIAKKASTKIRGTTSVVTAMTEPEEFCDEDDSISAPSSANRKIGGAVISGGSYANLFATAAVASSSRKSRSLSLVGSYEEDDEDQDDDDDEESIDSQRLSNEVFTSNNSRRISSSTDGSDASSFRKDVCDEESYNASELANSCGDYQEYLKEEFLKDNTENTTFNSSSSSEKSFYSQESQYSSRGGVPTRTSLIEHGNIAPLAVGSSSTIMSFSGNDSRSKLLPFFREEEEKCSKNENNKINSIDGVFKDTTTPASCCNVMSRRMRCYALLFGLFIVCGSVMITVGVMKGRQEYSSPFAFLWKKSSTIITSEDKKNSNADDNGKMTMIRGSKSSSRSNNKKEEGINVVTAATATTEPEK